MSDLDALLTLDEACKTLLRGFVKPATLTAAAKRGGYFAWTNGQREAAIRWGWIPGREIRPQRCVPCLNDECWIEREAAEAVGAKKVRKRA